MTENSRDRLEGGAGDDLLLDCLGANLLDGSEGRAWQPELLRLVRKPVAAYRRHRTGRHENENPLKEAA